MKKDYRLSIFQLILLVILIVNSVFYNFLSNYNIVVFLILVLIAFKFLFGFEKDRHRYSKDSIINLIVNLIIFFILYYLLGIFVTFTRNEGFYSLHGFLNFTLRVFIFIIIKEFYRYNLLCKSENSKFNIVLSVIIFILLDITNNIYAAPLANKYKLFEFIAVYVMPSLGNNIFATFLSKRVGYKPVILYLEVISLYTYLLPIHPDPNKYFYSVIWFCLPLVLLYREFNFFKKESDEDIGRNYNKKHISYLILAFLFTIVLVYFTSGNFHYHAMAIGSGSMTPKIRKGDVVIIEKLDEKYDKLEIGDVIAFKYSDVYIVHRIIDIVYDRGEYFFYTKGDFNKDPDDFVVEQSMVYGIVEHKIPFIGVPTVWLNEF